MSGNARLRILFLGAKERIGGGGLGGSLKGMRESI